MSENYKKLQVSGSTFYKMNKYVQIMSLNTKLSSHCIMSPQFNMYIYANIALFSIYMYVNIHHINTIYGNASVILCTYYVLEKEHHYDLLKIYMGHLIRSTTISAQKQHKYAESVVSS